MDLTTARWDLSLQDDRAKLQNREQPELFAGSPPGDDSSSLMNTCVESQEISKLKTDRIEPQIRACVQAYKLQMEMQKHFIHEHPMESTGWECLRFNPLSATRECLALRVLCVAGV